MGKPSHRRPDRPVAGHALRVSPGRCPRPAGSSASGCSYRRRQVRVEPARGVDPGPGGASAAVRRPARTGSRRRPRRELGQPLEGLAELARHDPHLVRVALRDLRQRLQVLVGQQRRVGPGGVDRGERRLDRLGLALGGQVRRGPLTLGPQDPGLPLGLPPQQYVVVPLPPDNYVLLNSDTLLSSRCKHPRTLQERFGWMLWACICEEKSPGPKIAWQPLED